VRREGGGVPDELDGFAGADGGDAAVAEHECLTVDELLFCDAVDCVHLVRRAVRRGEGELRFRQDRIGRVIGFAGLKIEEMIAGFVLTGDPSQKSEETSESYRAAGSSTAQTI
jgi:hypothetical protein